MQVQKEILVLAKSCKTGGYCVGGIELVLGDGGRKHLSNNWIRPVTVTQEGHHQGCLGKHLCTGFSVFDIIEINAEPAEHIPGQPENWLLQDTRIRKVTSLSQLDVIDMLAQQSGAIWFDDRTFRDDQISPAAVASAEQQHSLMVIQPENLTFTLEVEQKSYGLRKRISASFTHAGKFYSRINVTDPAVSKVFCNQFPAAPGVQYQKQLRNQDQYWMTLSLSSEFMGNHYVLAAAILDHSGYLNRSYG